jgi:alkylation response protein AidB-like acyl-CoA dehydrogenase
MNFDLTEEQKEIQKAVDAFAKGEFDKEAILDLERNHQFPFAYLKKACQLWFYRNSLSRRVWWSGVRNP